MCDDVQSFEKHVAYTGSVKMIKTQKERKQQRRKKISSALSAPSFTADNNSNHSRNCNPPQEVITP